jgi:hypothetical protein
MTTLLIQQDISKQLILQLGGGRFSLPRECCTLWSIKNTSDCRPKWDVTTTFNLQLRDEVLQDQQRYVVVVFWVCCFQPIWGQSPRIWHATPDPRQLLTVRVHTVYTAHWTLRQVLGLSFDQAEYIKFKIQRGNLFSDLKISHLCSSSSFYLHPYSSVGTKPPMFPPMYSSVFNS